MAGTKTSTAATAAHATAASLDTSKLDDLTPATTADPSGTMVEPEILERIDYGHPSVDNNPRAGATVTATRIDFNDPSSSASFNPAE